MNRGSTLLGHETLAIITIHNQGSISSRKSMDHLAKWLLGLAENSYSMLPMACHQLDENPIKLVQRPLFSWDFPFMLVSCDLTFMGLRFFEIPEWNRISNISVDLLNLTNSREIDLFYDEKIFLYGVEIRALACFI